MASVRYFETRAELEELLGPPRYALKGSLYRLSNGDGSALLVERVEIYQKHGCNIEIAFAEDRLCAVIGCVPWTVCEILAKSPDH